MGMSLLAGREDIGVAYSQLERDTETERERDQQHIPSEIMFHKQSCVCRILCLFLMPNNVFFTIDFIYHYFHPIDFYSNY